MKEISCIICKSSSYKLLCNVHSDKFAELLGKFKAIKKVICSECGFVYQTPQWEENELRQLYGKFRSCATPPESYLESKTEKAQKDFSWIKDYTHSNSGKRILDIGCAEGNFLRLFQEENWEVYGVEPTDYGKYGRDRYGLDIRSGFFEAIDFPEGYFDIVSMLRVIEHVRDPIRVLSEAKRVLKDGCGLLYIQTPNVLRPYGNPKEFFGSQHLWLFSPLTLGSLLKNISFSIIKLETKYGGLRLLAKKTDDAARPYRRICNTDTEVYSSDRINYKKRLQIFIIKVARNIYYFHYFFILYLNIPLRLLRGCKKVINKSIIFK